MITLTLPTRRERCQFAVKPVVATVGAFLQDIQREDKGIVKAEVFATGILHLSAFRVNKFLFKSSVLPL